MQEKEPFLVHIGESKSLEVTPEQAAQLDIIPSGDGRFHILSDGKKYVAELVNVDYSQRIFLIKVNGNTFPVHIADRFERLVKNMGLSVGGAQKVNEIKAPMPGMVIQILVTPGQNVQKGDPLLILEAMKMENVLKSAGEATVKSIEVTKGNPVDKGAVLIRFE